MSRRRIVLLVVVTGLVLIAVSLVLAGWDRGAPTRTSSLGESQFSGSPAVA